MEIAIRAGTQSEAKFQAQKFGKAEAHPIIGKVHEKIENKTKLTKNENLN